MPILELLDFRYGANTKDAAHEILQEQSSDLQNVDVSQKGKTVTIPGFAKLNTNVIGGSPTGIYGAFYGKSTHLAATGTDVWKKTSGDYSSLKASLTSNAQTYFGEYNNYIGVVNGSDAPWKWSGSAVSTFTYPPTAWATANYPNYIASDDVRFWMFCVADDTLYWCSAGNQDKWVKANVRGGYDASVNVFPSTGGSGTAGAIMKGDLWGIAVAGTLGGTAVVINQSIEALIDTPGQTAGNWSILGISDVSDAGYQAIGYKNGYTGTGIIAQSDGLVVFKQKGIWKVFGISSFSFEKKYAETGCIAPRSLLKKDNKIFFLDKSEGINGIYCLDDTLQLHYLSELIEPTLALMTSGSESLACAGWYNNKYVLSFPVTGGWKTVRLNYKDMTWEIDDGNSMRCYYNDTNGLLYGGSTSAGYVYTMDTGTSFDTAAINSYVKKDPIKFPEGNEYTKKIKEIWLWVKASGNYKLSINFYVNSNLQSHTYYAQLGTKGTTQTTRLEKVKLPDNIQGNTIGIKIGNNAVSEPWELYKTAILYDVDEPKSH